MKLQRLGVIALAAAAGGSANAAEIPTFAARTEVVRIDALVTRDRQPVRGLTAADFDVRDNGARQAIELARPELTSVNVVLALDLSSSVAGERLEHLKNAGRGLLDALQRGDRAGLVTFSQAVTIVSKLSPDAGPLKTALAELRPSGETSLFDASYAALTVGGVESGRGLVIVFSDGVDISSWLTSDVVLDTARRSESVVYAVATGRVAGMPFLRDLTSATGGRVFDIESTKDLGSAFLGILDEFRQRYRLYYSPSGVLTKGWHRLDVRVKGQKATVRARPGYLVGP